MRIPPTNPASIAIERALADLRAKARRGILRRSA